MVDEGRFETGRLSGDLGAVGSEPRAPSPWAAERSRNEQVDLDIGPAPGPRANGELEPGGLERVGERRLIVELARVDGEVAVGGVVP